MGPEKKLKRVVLDTNVVLSALLFSGATARLVGMWQSRQFELLVCASILKEYTRVLAYPKFQLDQKLIIDILHHDILPYVTPVSIPAHIPPVILEDPTDDIFLACAVSGTADALVSGDMHLLRLGQYNGIPILDPSAFLKLF
jgi:putative PIN family toxin of toxin-antitoxin system